MHQNRKAFVAITKVQKTHTHTKTPEYFMIRHPTSPLPLKQREEVTKNKVTAKI